MIENKASAIILSGGKSSRMGKAKESLKINDLYLLDLIIENLREYFEQVIVVTNNENFLKNIRQAKNILVTSDIYKDMGPCAGLHAGLNISSNEDNYLYACDMPYINCSYIKFLKSSNYKNALVYKSQRGLEPFQAMYKRDLIANLEDYLKAGKRSLNGFLKGLDIDIVDRKKLDIEGIEKIFENLNYPKDWEKFIKEYSNASNKKIPN